MIQIAGIADLLSHLHQVAQRLSNRFGGGVSDHNTQGQRDQGAGQGDEDGGGLGSAVGPPSILEHFLVFLIGQFQVLGG